MTSYDKWEIHFLINENNYVKVHQINFKIKNPEMIAHLCLNYNVRKGAIISLFKEIFDSCSVFTS